MLNSKRTFSGAVRCCLETERSDDAVAARDLYLCISCDDKSAPNL